MRTLYVEITWTEHETQIKQQEYGKGVLLYSQNNEILWLWTMADTSVCEIHEVRKGLWTFSLILLFGCWLANQANSDHVVIFSCGFFLEMGLKLEVEEVEEYNLEDKSIR